MSVLDGSEENTLIKIARTLDEKTKLVKDQTTAMDVKSEEIRLAEADLQEYEVLLQCNLRIRQFLIRNLCAKNSVQLIRPTRWAIRIMIRSLKRGFPSWSVTAWGSKKW